MEKFQKERAAFEAAQQLMLARIRHNLEHRGLRNASDEVCIQMARDLKKREGEPTAPLIKQYDNIEEFFSSRCPSCWKPAAKQLLEWMDESGGDRSMWGDTKKEVEGNRAAFCSVFWP